MAGHNKGFATREIQQHFLEGILILFLTMRLNGLTRSLFV